jgi:MFS family permease
MGIYQIGIYLGSASALVIGGVIFAHLPPGGTVMVPLAGAMKGWQLVFLLLGIPGLLLTLVTLTLREPARRGEAGDKTAAQDSVPLSQFFAHIGARAKAYIGIMLGFALMVLVGNGTAVWIPAFLERSYGWTTAQVGSLYGPVVFVCGTSGALTGGLVASWLRKRGLAHGNLQASMIGFTALVPVTIAFPLMPTAGMALVLIGLMNFLAGFNFGGGLATLQELTPNRMRADVGGLYADDQPDRRGAGPHGHRAGDRLWFSRPQGAALRDLDRLRRGLAAVGGAAVDGDEGLSPDHRGDLACGRAPSGALPQYDS